MLGTMWGRLKIGDDALDATMCGSSLVLLREGRVFIYSEFCIKRVYERVVALPLCVSDAGVVAMGTAGRTLVLAFSHHMQFVGTGVKYKLSPQRCGAALIALATAPCYVAVAFDSGEVVVWQLLRLCLVRCWRQMLPWPAHGLLLAGDGTGVVANNGNRNLCVKRDGTVRACRRAVAVAAGGEPVEVGVTWRRVGDVMVRDLGAEKTSNVPVEVEWHGGVRVGGMVQPWRVPWGCLRVCSAGLLVLRSCEKMGGGKRLRVHMYARCPHCGAPAPYDALRYADLLILGARGLFNLLPPCILRELMVMRRVQCPCTV